MNPMSHGAGVARANRAKCLRPRRVQGPPLFGARHWRTQRFYGQRAARGTSKLCLEFLPQLQPRFPTALLSRMLDNATSHPSRAVKRFLPQHAWVVLEPLAPYAPECNPLERFWQWRKAEVYGAMAFDPIDDVINKVRQLVWHYHEGWLTSTIHLHCTDYQGIL